MASPKPTSASAIISALKEYGIEFTPAREKALLKTINTLFKTQTSDQVSTYVATKVAFITKQLKAIGLDTGLGDANGDGKISAAELAALKAEIKASAKTAADTGSAPGDTATVSLTGDKSSATEGKDTVTYTVKGTAGATYTWTVDDTHVNDVVTAAGTVTLGANGEGTFTVVAKQDNVTESAEVVKVTLLDSTASVVANTNLIIQEDPGAAAALAVDATSITEGGTAATFTVTGLAGSTYTWTIDSNHVSDVDLAGNVITLDATGKATFTVKAKQDNTAESAEVTTISLLDATGVVVGTKLLTIVEDPLVGATFTLTTGIDTVAGTVSNDTINSLVSGALSPFDNIDGGDGTDTLNVTDTAALATSANVTVKNVEVANLLSAAGITADTSAWTGLTTLNTNSVGTTTITAASTANVTATVNTLAAANATVNGGKDVSLTATGSTTGQLKVGETTAPAGKITVSNTTTGAVNAGAIHVVGGTEITVTQATSNAVATTAGTGSVTVTGGDKTTSVTVTATKAVAQSATVAGVNNNTVSIVDVNGGSSTKDGTITTVSISGYTTVGISDNALTTLSLTNGTGNIIIDNSGLGILATNTTLGLTLDGVTGGTLDDADIYTALNVTTANNASTLANITEGAVTALTVDGTKGLTLTSAAGLTALKTVTVKGSAGIVADLSGATVTTVDTSASTGTSTVTIDPSKASFTGGAGVDTVSLTNVASSKAISLGAGDDFLTLNNGSVPTAVISGGDGTDTLSLSAANAATASGNATFAGKVTAFEKVVLTGATNQTVDLSVLGNFNYVTTSGGNGLTLSNLPTGGTLVLNGAGTAYTIGNSAFAAGTNDVVNLNLTDGSGAAVSFASTGITASGVETFAITTADTNTTTHLPVVDLVTLLGNSVKTITVAGNAGLNLTAASTALTNVDASAITAGGFTFTSGALAADATIKGSAAYVTNTVNFSAATGIVTYTGGDGDDVINASNGKANVIDLGKGGLGNSVTGLAGNQTITALDGDDTVNLTSGNNIVNLGDGDNSFTATSGNNTYTGGDGIDTVVVGSGANIIHLGGGTTANTVTVGAAAGLNVIDTTSTGVDTVVLGGIQTAAGYYTSVSGLTAGDIINFTSVGTTASEATLGTKITLGGNASFANYLDAAVAGNATDALNWFQFGGNTYVTVDNGANPTFSDGIDSVIELVGTVDLSTAVNAAGVLTLH